MSRFLTLPLALFFSLTTQAKECIDWGKVFAQETIRKLAPSQTIIQVLPFNNDTDLKGDAWLSAGIAHLLQRYLSTSGNVTALSARDAKYLASPQRAAYSIEGLFQHTQDWLRIFVQLKNDQGKIVAQFPVETPFPLHNQFFTGLQKGAEAILQKIEKSVNPEALKAIANETAKVHAFENYSKGKQALQTYHRNQIEVALIWFQESRREDHTYPQPYFGMAEAYSFLILDAKQRGEDYTAYLEALQNTLKELARQTGPKINPMENPILKAHVHYVTGQRALAKEEAAKAMTELAKAWALVPYDAATAYALSQSYAKLGKTSEAAKYRDLAGAINPCLK